MKIEGLNVDVLAVVKRKGKLVFRRGRQTFAIVRMDAFGFDQPTSQVPVTVYRKRNKSMEYQDTFFCVYIGGHQDGPILNTHKGSEAGTLVAENFFEGDRLVVAGHRQSPVGRISSLYAR